MRWVIACAWASLLLMLTQRASAETVRDPAGDFSVELTDPNARFCTALPASDDGGACTAGDLALGQALAGATVNETRALALVIAHFDDWDETLFVTRTEGHEGEVSQRSADSFVGGLREGIGKRLLPGDQVVDADQAARAGLLRIRDVQVVRGIVRIQHGNEAAQTTSKSKIAYQVIARDATYNLLFSADDTRFDEALAFAQRSVATVRTLPATPAATSGSGSNPREYAASVRGKRWASIFGVGAALILALMWWINRRPAK